MKKKEKSSSSYVYFVLYIVVIAELMVVIHERDVLLAELQGKLTKLEVGKYLMPIRLEVPNKENDFTLSYNEQIEIKTNCVSMNTVSEEEVNAGFILGELQQESKKIFGNHFPPTLSSLNSDPNQKIYLKKDKSNCYLILKANQKEFDNTEAKSSFLANKKLPVIYKVVLKTPRILPSNYSYGTIDSIFNKILEPASDKIIQDSMKISDKKEIELQKKRIILQYIMGLDAKQLYNLIENTEERYYFDNTQIKSKLGMIKQKISSNSAKEEDYHKEFKDFYIGQFKGKSQFGFDSSDYFYYFTTEPINLQVNLSFY